MKTLTAAIVLAVTTFSAACAAAPVTDTPPRNPWRGEPAGFVVLTVDASHTRIEARHDVPATRLPAPDAANHASW